MKGNTGNCRCQGHFSHKKEATKIKKNKKNTAKQNQ